MASVFKIRTIDDRIKSLKLDNPAYSKITIEKTAHEIRENAKRRVQRMIPLRFKNAEMSDNEIVGKNIKNAIEDIFQDPPKGKVGIIFTGSAGCGKTHMAIATLKFVAEMDPECVSYFGFYPKIIQDLRTEFSDGTYINNGSMWDTLCNESGLASGLIVVDDIASAKPSDFELEKFFMFIDKRTNDFAPAILTTNIPPDKFEDVFGQRISSRLLGYFHIVSFPDYDFRDK